MWTEAVVAYFEVPSQHFSGSRIEPGTYRMEVQ